MAKHYLSADNNKKFLTIALITALLTLVVIMLGAYTRLSDAGLGCPDWPGCYGKFILPQAQHHLTQLQMLFPSQPLVAHKAWIEMIHRYFAGTLGLIILALAVWATVRRMKDRSQSIITPWLLVGVVMFQALLGMWTVTLKLLPLIVMGHLLGGMTLAALLWWLTLSAKAKPLHISPRTASLKRWAIFGLIVLAGQIILGAWTSTNYAALACSSTFPNCNGTLFPNMDWTRAFNFLSPVGPSYEGGRLSMDARVTIQMAHRYGAFLTAAYLTTFSLVLITIRDFAPLRKYGWAILAILATQLTLGILNVELTLPMWTAVSHTAVATLLLLSMVTVIYRLYAKKSGDITLNKIVTTHTEEPATLRDFFELTKPRVVALMLLTSIIAMFLASPTGTVSWQILLFGSLGIGLAAGAGAAINHLIDRKIDAMMARTKGRPIPSGRVRPMQAIVLATIFTVLSMWILTELVNPLTAVLSLLTLIGYAGIYTLFLKRTTPQNIVIGGLAGAMPPLLGWSAVTDRIDAFPLLLVLIIFAWTPPHFWALSIARYKEYAKAKIPMLPVTHGIKTTKRFVLLYTLLLVAVTYLPFIVDMSGLIYLVGISILNIGFLRHSIKLFRGEGDHNAMATFRYSILYMACTFILLFVDHYYPLLT